jgi:hypothetical protein
MPSPMKVGTTVMMNSSIAASSRKDPMMLPPPGHTLGPQGALFTRLPRGFTARGSSANRKLSTNGLVGDQ